MDNGKIDKKKIINKLIWIDAKVKNEENTKYQKHLMEIYKLNIEAYETVEEGIKALEKIQFESIFVITSGTIYPEFFSYMKREYEELRVVPFSIIFTSSKKKFYEKHQNDEIGKIYNQTFFNRGGVVDRFNGVISFINEIYSDLDNFKISNKYEGIYTKNYSGLIVFEKVDKNLPLPEFYEDIYKNRNIDFSLLNNFTKFFLQNFCTKSIEKLLKPLILFKEVPEVIISKWWARVYTHETPFYSIMNKSLMRKEYKEYEIYIKLLYKGLACNSYRPKYKDNLTRGTKLERSEINYLKSISGTGKIIMNKSFLSFSLNEKKAIKFKDNCDRDDEDSEEVTENKNQELKLNPLKNSEIFESRDIEEEKIGLDVLIQISNISEMEKNDYVISNAFLKDISCYSKEEEVLVFPFTGFEVIGWDNISFENANKKEVEGTIFYLKFSKKYYDKIKAKYNY